MTKKNKGVLDRVIVTPDKHFPLADLPAIKCVTKAIALARPTKYIDLGDVGEWHGCSHWQWRKRKRPPLEYQLPYIEQDVKDVNSGMDIIDEALDKVSCKEKYMIEGNHDDWMNRFVEDNPYLPQYKFANAVNLKERGYKYKKMGDFLKIGKLYYYHGHHFAGVHHSRNHLLRIGANLMYGHHHDIQQSSVTHIDGAKSAWSIGCLKDMESEKNAWLGGRKHNWSHAFAIVEYYDKGFFTVNVIQIIDGKTCLWGELLDGNK